MCAVCLVFSARFACVDCPVDSVFLVLVYFVVLGFLLALFSSFAQLI